VCKTATVSLKRYGRFYFGWNLWLVMLYRKIEQCFPQANDCLKKYKENTVLTVALPFFVVTIVLSSERR
jgi:hypothetical protein